MYNSVRGKIRSYWEKHGKEVRMKVSVPANTSAQIFLPGASLADVYEGKQNILNSDLQAKQKDEGAIVSVGSGDYTFIYTERKLTKLDTGCTI